MPFFYFHTADGPDDEGVVFPHARSVREAAVRAAGETLRDLRAKLPADGWWMAVTDTAGALVFTLTVTAKDYAPAADEKLGSLDNRRD